MPYSVKLIPSARKVLAKLSKKSQKRILLALALLRNAPRPPGAKKLSGAAHLYRIRVESYRIIYEIREDILLVLVVRIGHRREIYRSQ